MSPTELMARRPGRAVSPALFALALICFCFTFVGVSCNTDAAKQTLSGASSLTGGQGQPQSQQLNSCLEALKNHELFSYSGITFVTGGSPSTLTSSPAPCRVGQTGIPGADSATSAGNATIGVQPLAIVALAAAGLGILVGATTVLRLLRSPVQFLVMTGLALLGLLMLVLNQAHAQSAILGRMDALATGSGAPFSVRDYFVLHTGVAYWLALVALGVAALYSVAAGLFRPPPQASVHARPAVSGPETTHPPP